MLVRLQAPAPAVEKGEGLPQAFLQVFNGAAKLVLPSDDAIWPYRNEDSEDFFFLCLSAQALSRSCACISRASGPRRNIKQRTHVEISETRVVLSSGAATVALQNLTRKRLEVCTSRGLARNASSLFPLAMTCNDYMQSMHMTMPNTDW